MATTKKMTLTFTVAVGVEARPFPVPLAIPELKRDHAVQTRALDALTLSPELTAILTHVVMRDEFFVEKIAEAWKFPSKEALRKAAEAGDDLQEGKVAWRAADISLRDLPDAIIDIALARLDMTSVTVSEATAQLLPHADTIPASVD